MFYNILVFCTKLHLILNVTSYIAKFLVHSYSSVAKCCMLTCVNTYI